MESRRRDGLRRAQVGNPIYDRAGHLQHRLLRAERAVPEVPRRYPGGEPVAGGVLGGEYWVVRDFEEAGQNLLKTLTQRHRDTEEDIFCLSLWLSVSVSDFGLLAEGGQGVG